MFQGFQDNQKDNLLDNNRTVYSQHSYCYNKGNYHDIKCELFKPEALTKGTRDSSITVDSVRGPIMKWLQQQQQRDKDFSNSYNVLNTSANSLSKFS